MESNQPDAVKLNATVQLNSGDAKVEPEHPPGDPNVAIIAIHGVGQHLSGASAGAVSTLLMSIGKSMAGKENVGEEDIGPKKQNEEPSPEPAPLYSGFVATSIDVPLRPVQAPPDEATGANERHQDTWLSTVWGIFDERRGYLAAARKNANYVPGYTKRELRPNEPDRGEYSYQFMLTQVAGYQGDVDRKFETVRLEGKRAANSPAATVHIYDAHYSDLSKSESSILSFFLAFYQLLFHLASLSLLAVYWAEAENVKADNRRRWRWRIKSSVHAASVRLLTMWVPCLNLILLEIACSAFADKTQGWSPLPALSIAFAATLSLVATFVLARKAPSPSRPFLWAAIPFLGAGLGALLLSGLACLYNHIFHLQLPLSETLLLLGWLLAAGLILGWIASLFDPLRPGVFWLAVALYVFNLFLFLFYLLPHAARTSGVGQNQVATASLWAVQWIFGELLLSWILCLLSALLSWPLGVLCIHGIEKSDISRKARAIAAFRTGRFAFASPAILLMIVTCALWSGVVVDGSHKLKAFDGVPPCVANLGSSARTLPSIIIPSVDSVQEWMRPTSPQVPRPANQSDKSLAYAPKPCGAPEQEPPWSDYLTGLLLVSVTPGLPITMAILVLSLFLLTWAVLPSIVFEMKPEWTENATTNHIRWLGEWMSRGLDNTAVLTRLLWCAVVPVPLFFFAFDWLALHHLLPPALLGALYSASKFTLRMITYGGFILAVSGAAIFGFILKYLTKVLDTILDVDNYLRASPKDRTPRARIAERCTSLLRYIADQNPPYSKVIIVAHSLGSMVTTDLLRYLERSGGDSPDPGLARYAFRQEPIPSGQSKLPIYVFSMGSPLRQLLNRFFPHLYWWVSDVPDNSLAALGAPVGPPMPAIDIPSLPRTDEMNVARWANAYRSGDYVGRSLWVGQWLNRSGTGDTRQPPDIARAGAPQSCTEMCIGLGSHTHYWDRTAPEVAALLDLLITELHR